LNLSWAGILVILAVNLCGADDSAAKFRGGVADALVLLGLVVAHFAYATK
jgi:hypothetical protein